MTNGVLCFDRRESLVTGLEFYLLDIDWLILRWSSEPRISYRATHGQSIDVLWSTVISSFEPIFVRLWCTSICVWFLELKPPHWQPLIKNVRITTHFFALEKHELDQLNGRLSIGCWTREYAQWQVAFARCVCSPTTAILNVGACWRLTRLPTESAQTSTIKLASNRRSPKDREIIIRFFVLLSN